MLSSFCSQPLALFGFFTFLPNPFFLNYPLKFVLKEVIFEFAEFSLGFDGDAQNSGHAYKNRDCRETVKQRFSFHRDPPF